MKKKINSHITLENTNYEIIKKIETGSNAQCFVIKNKNQNKFFLKITQCFLETGIVCSTFPRLIQTGKYFNDDFFIYQFIDGKNLDKKIKINNLSFRKLLNLLIDIDNEGYALFDLQLTNIMIDKKNNFYFVDHGMVKPKSKAFQDFRVPSLEKYINEPSEYKCTNGITTNLYTESIEIYYYGAFISLLNLNLNTRNQSILNKMKDKDLRNRYKNCKELKKDLTKKDFFDVSIKIFSNK